MDNKRVLTTADKQLYESYVAHHPDYCGMHADFCGVYEWSVYDDCLLIERDGYITTKRSYGGQDVYLSPFTLQGYSFEDAVNDIFCKADDKYNTIIQLMPKELADSLDPRLYKICERRKDFDYIYKAEDLIGLGGKKFHSKRNHISKFESNYAFDFRPYVDSDFDEIMELFAEWQNGQDDPIQSRFEKAALLRALRAHKELGYMTGVILIDKKICAFGVCSISVNNVGQVHFEKADRRYEGIYAAINKYVAREFLSGCTYINRQDDLGLEGLRKAKMSYNPVFLVEKYSAALRK